MGFDVDQLKTYVIMPTLKKLDLWSKSAENLLLGTCAQESNLGRYVRQIGGGPAMGIYQMEPATYFDIWKNFIIPRRDLRDRMLDLFPTIPFATIPHESRLMTDLSFATAMARIHYMRISELLPRHDDVEGMALYWKRYYNTPKGKGTLEEFTRNYMFYIDNKGQDE